MTKEFWRAALIRCVRTMAQTAAGMITVGATVSEIDWGLTAGIAAVSGIYCLLMALAGLPEAPPQPGEGGAA